MASHKRKNNGRFWASSLGLIASCSSTYYPIRPMNSTCPWRFRPPVSSTGWEQMSTAVICSPARWPGPN